MLYLLSSKFILISEQGKKCNITSGNSINMNCAPAYIIHGSGKIRDKKSALHILENTYLLFSSLVCRLWSVCFGLFHFLPSFLRDGLSSLSILGPNRKGSNLLFSHIHLSSQNQHHSRTFSAYCHQLHQALYYQFPNHKRNKTAYNKYTVIIYALCLCNRICL